jgi:predicted dehydrogenase
MKEGGDRRGFIRKATFAGLGYAFLSRQRAMKQPGKPGVTRVGIIGLDTEHSVFFTRILNDPAANLAIAGFRVVAAYPYGSRDIEFCIKTIPTVTEELKKTGIEIVDSIQALLEKTDVILLETNDGRLHLEQALPVIKAGKPLFIDKPIAASLADAQLIFEIAKHHKVPVFSASSLRYMTNAQEIRNGSIGAVLGADTYSPALIEKTHPDLFWYGIHGIETLFTVMGTGCESVTRYYSEDVDIIIGIWKDGRKGTFRGIRKGQTGLGGTAFGTKAILPIGPWQSYQPLVEEIARFFRTGKAPVSSEETLEIIAFMEAAEESKKNGSKIVNLESVVKKAKKKNLQADRIAFFQEGKL